VKFAKGATWGPLSFTTVASILLMAWGLRFLFAPAFPAEQDLGLLMVVVAALGFVFAGLLAWFFRDPERAAGEGVVSPADGRVSRLEVEGSVVRLSVHLGPLDVHVVRAPIAASLDSQMHIEGAHKFAFSKDSEHNERQVVALQGEGEAAELVLIAGAFANRIVTYLKEPGEAVAKGGRVGLIRYGSRVDLTYRSAGAVDPAVAVGDKVLAGETTIVRLRAKEPRP
jgi:phosphatidylserine decarboxylase